MRKAGGRLPAPCPLHQNSVLRRDAPRLHRNSSSYRNRAVLEPRRVQAEFGTETDADRRIRVHDSTANMRYMILPMCPAGGEGMSEEALAGPVTRDSLIGVTEPRAR